jgi:hypothetical protein
MQHTKLDALKDELAAIELDQRFEMINVTPDLVDVDIENFICKPTPKAPTPEPSEQ